ncbi:hypothetical protein R3I94_013018 [Phoxinus phoxinus]
MYGKSALNFLLLCFKENIKLMGLIHKKALEMLNQRNNQIKSSWKSKNFKFKELKLKKEKLNSSYKKWLKKIKEQDFVARNTTLIVEEENLFQKYAKLIIETAKKAGRNTYPLLSMKSGVFRCPIVRRTTQNIKELNETSDIQQSNKSLRFTW